MNTIETHEGAVAHEHPPEHVAHHDVRVTTRLLPAGAESKFELAESAPLSEVLREGTLRAGVELLPPPPLAPLDRFHNILKGGEVGPPITDLSQPLGAFLKEKDATKHFGIELVLAIRVNTRWAIATGHHMTPREILALPGINLDPTQYTLYLPESAKPLPIDQPIHITRGEAFEAQRDGKYGGCP